MKSARGGPARRPGLLRWHDDGRGVAWARAARGAPRSSVPHRAPRACESDPASPAAGAVGARPRGRGRPEGGCAADVGYVVGKVLIISLDPFLTSSTGTTRTCQIPIPLHDTVLYRVATGTAPDNLRRRQTLSESVWQLAQAPSQGAASYVQLRRLQQFVYPTAATRGSSCPRAAPSRSVPPGAELRRRTELAATQSRTTRSSRARAPGLPKQPWMGCADRAEGSLDSVPVGPRDSAAGAIAVRTLQGCRSAPAPGRDLMIS
eukprot:COSAG03_NODE_2365_length_2843_cov_1435.211735_2_plen_262_part_00